MKFVDEAYIDIVAGDGGAHHAEMIGVATRLQPLAEEARPLRRERRGIGERDDRGALLRRADVDGGDERPGRER